ncbi:MAG TPA: Gfo/Idh/MocA family oxidoreductase [Tepidisphaeraceae bacterium]|nr:Gfo/Idh/MocA family oxidoreductase [Tepidisphaeraceae bacterium]
MINVGVLGLGMMGLTHLNVYQKRSDVHVVAISDKLPDRLEGKVKAAGNIEGMAKGGFDYASARKYLEGVDLIRDPEVQVVDICLPTPMHLEFARMALEAGKHVLLEKPMCRSAADAKQLSAAARNAKGLTMVAMCMRFWPGWTWLKAAVAEQRYGKVLAAHFRRLSTHPGGSFYRNGELSGGGILDFHIHDTDFVQHLFGMPESVYSVGYSKITSEIDHVITHYRYPNVPLVVAEGGWAMAPGFQFKMQYTVNFERATAVYDHGTPKPLMLYEPPKEPQAVQLEAGMGYDYEIAYFLDCIRNGQPPKIVTLKDAINSLRIVEAESQSAKTGLPVSLEAGI